MHAHTQHDLFYRLITTSSPQDLSCEEPEAAAASEPIPPPPPPTAAVTTSPIAPGMSFNMREITFILCDTSFYVVIRVPMHEWYVMSMNSYVLVMYS